MRRCLLKGRSLVLSCRCAADQASSAESVSSAAAALLGPPRHIFDILNPQKHETGGFVNRGIGWIRFVQLCPRFRWAALCLVFPAIAAAQSPSRTHKTPKLYHFVPATASSRCALAQRDDALRDLAVRSLKLKRASDHSCALQDGVGGPDAVQTTRGRLAMGAIE